MTLNVTIDWKSIAATGVAIGMVILSLKIDSSDAGRVLADVANAWK